MWTVPSVSSKAQASSDSSDQPWLLVGATRINDSTTAVELVVAGQAGKVLLDIAGVLGAGVLGAGVLGGRTNGTTA